MSEQHMTRARRLANERSLYRYNRAFERGDIETIAAILQTASQDEELERMIYAMHDLDQPAEQPPAFDFLRTQNTPPTSTTRLPQPVLQSSPRRPMRGQRSRARLQTLAAVLVVVALIVGSLLLLHSRHLALVTGNHTSTSGPTKTVATPQGMVFLLFTNGDVQARRGVTGQHVWSYSTGQQDLGDPNKPYGGLIVQSQVVYVMAKNHVYALNEHTGKVLWQKTLPVHPVNFAPNESQMLIDAGIVYVSIQSEPQSIAYALRSSDGTLLWQVASTDVNPPLVTANNGIAYMAIQNAAMTQTMLEARRGSDGHVIWSYLSPGVVSFGTVANHVLYIYAFPGAVPPAGDSKPNKRLLAFKTSNGDVIWSRDVHYGNYTTNIVYAQGTLVVDDGGQLCVHSASNGGFLWCTQNPSPSVNVSSYLVGSDKLYVAYIIETGIPLKIEALDLQHGQPQWTSFEIVYNDTNLFLALGQVQIQQNTLLVAGGSPLLTALDTSNGHILWHINGSSPASVLQIVATA
jgi:outer membrane protein assembly factor BamB